MKTAILIILQLGASGSDAYITRQNANMKGFYEKNPIARPFVHSDAATIAYFGAGAGIKIYAPHFLRKHGHQRLADAIAIAGIADNASCALYSSTH